MTAEWIWMRTVSVLIDHLMDQLGHRCDVRA